MCSEFNHGNSLCGNPDKHGSDWGAERRSVLGGFDLQLGGGWCLLKCSLAVSRARAAATRYRPPSSHIALWLLRSGSHDHTGPINPVMALMNLAVVKVTFKVSGGIVSTLWEYFN